VAGSGVPRGVLIALAVTSIIIGLVIVVVARGLLRGSRGSRFVVTVFTILSLLSGVYSVVQHQYASGILTALIAVIILALLWSGRAAAFFRS
jgi:hypothetical protein